MSSNTSHLRTRSDRYRPAAGASLASLVGYPLVLIALLVVASYPMATVAVLTVTALGTKVAQVALAALVRRSGKTPRQVTVPGVGTVTVQVAPR